MDVPLTGQQMNCWGIYWGYIGVNGEENGSYRDYVGAYRDNRVCIGVVLGLMEKKMEATGII